MEPYKEVEEWLKEYIKERNKLYDRICERELILLEVKQIIEQTTVHLVLHLRVFLLNQKIPQNLKAITQKEGGA